MTIELVPLDDVAPTAVEALLDRAFGTDRHGRTAYRLREGTQAIASLSFAALDAGAFVGSIQCWPVSLRCADGSESPMVMVGPVAVAPERQRDGLGRMLMSRMLEAADASAEPGTDALMMIGDPEYYGRFFGFTAERTSGWQLPGPFEPRRLLARGAAAPDCAGVVAPRLLATA